MYFHRALELLLQQAVQQFPVAIITGARQVGKSTLLRNSLASFAYISLDEPLLRELAHKDPQLFLDRFAAPLIIDEIQYAPGLLPYIKIRVDKNRDLLGQYVLTGSQAFSLMKGVSETLAGRTAIFELYPPSWNEIPTNIDVYDPNQVVAQIIKGFYPEFFVRPQLDHRTWYSSYLSTYIERDVRQIINITDLNKFQTFISLLAARVGQLFNASEVAKECRISVPTVNSWLSVLEASYVVKIVKPYFKNITKRLVKSPKLFFIDTGLLCYLLGIDSVDRFFRASEGGFIFENMVIMDCLKRLHQQNLYSKIYFFRTASGLEADLLVEKQGMLTAFEIKMSSTPDARMANSLVKVGQELGLTKSFIASMAKDRVPLKSGIEAIHWSHLAQEL